jgi:type II restriction/modification system DNA methylase subunit YeeA
MTNNTSSTTPIPNIYRASASDFNKISGSPIAYWVNPNFFDIFKKEKNIDSIAPPRIGMMTTDNNRFLRYWHELSLNVIGFYYRSISEASQSETKWFPYNKGGNFRKWAGNSELVVNWYKEGNEIKEAGMTSFRGKDFYFQEGITWGDISSSVFSCRHSSIGKIFDIKGTSCFPTKKDFPIVIAVLNSKVGTFILQFLNPTITYQSGDIRRIPIPYDKIHSQISSDKVYYLISMTQNDWDSYETSWDFTTLPLLQPENRKSNIRETYTKLRVHWKEMTLEMQRLEEENNRIFIDAYGLQDELTHEVPLSEITLTCNPYYRYNGDRSEEELEALLLTDTIKEFISYAVGCMFGRYSLDKTGLVLANQGEKIGDYLEQVPEPSFMPDADNIIPILEDEYFEDDIVSRFKEFLKVTFGEDTLSENLDYIAEALGGSGKKSSEAVIRDYFLKSFYKDHLKMYKKRPIYWMFSSGKGKAFNALIYMHRYNKETLALMRTDYLLELEGKLDAKREMIKSDIGKDAQEKARLGKMIDEIMEYDELLKNKADEYIEIDLDDGVKMNYKKFEGLVEKI